MPSFDIVSQLNMQEVDNAVAQTSKEILQRYDFKDSNSKIVREEKVIKIDSTDDSKVAAVYDVLQSKLVKRGVSLKSVEPKKVEPAAGGRAKQEVVLKDGIESENAKEIVKIIKDLKLKVQPTIQGDTVRVTGKKRDDLQEAIAAIRGADYKLPLQFNNFRD
jgi:uncharacterized protein YajQ (UPF0234 family)